MKGTQFHTYCFGGHGNKFISWDIYLVSFVLCRVNRDGKFLLAHVPSHHVAKSQDGTMLSLRTLWLKTFIYTYSSQKKQKKADSGLHGCFW